MGPKRRHSKAKGKDQGYGYGPGGELSAEELAALYGNKNFRPPEPAELETIYETETSAGVGLTPPSPSSTPVEKENKGNGTGRRRAARACNGMAGKPQVEGELVLGKNKRRRFLEPAKYWLEDKARTRHRQKMANKSFKGKKKLKLVALSTEEEVKLHDLISRSSEAHPSQPSPSKTPSSRPNAVSASSHLSTPCGIPTTPATPASASTTPVPLGPRGRFPATPGSAFLPSPSPCLSARARKSRRRSSLLRRGLSNSLGVDAETVSDLGAAPNESLSLNPSFDVEGGSSPQMDAELLKKIAEADELFGVVSSHSTADSSGRLPSLDTHREKDIDEKENTLAENQGCCENFDDVFAAFAANKKVKKAKRDSVHVKVRRSSRFFKVSEETKDETVGSVFQLAEISEAKIRRRLSAITNLTHNEMA